MSDAIAPSQEDMLDEEGVTEVDIKSAPWRHGSYITAVYHRAEDDTFWQAYYRRSTDGETNELREGLATITRVYPVQVTVTQYSKIAPVPA